MSATGMPAPPPDAGADPSASAPDDDAAGGDDQGTPICTVMGHSDGTFSLVMGDGDDEGDEGGADAGGAAGAAAGAPAAAGAGAEDQGQSFTDIGSLLKGVMQSVKEFQAESGGSSDQKNFEAGFAGSDTSGPSAPPSPAPKAV